MKPKGVMDRVMLKDTVDEIVKKYRIDAVYVKNNILMNWEEVCKDLEIGLIQILGDTESNNYVICPGGILGLKLADILSHVECHIEYIIDNNSDMKEYKGIPVITYSEYISKRRNDTILLASPSSIGKAFQNALWWDGYEGRIVNIYQYLQETYHNLEKIPDYDNPCIWWDYKYLNKLETDCNNTNENTKIEKIRLLIYGLITIRDFCYAEKYIEKLSTYDQYYQNYRNAIQEIKNAINDVVNSKNNNVWFIHILDALAESHVDKMPILKKMAQEGIRIKGIITEYPYTRFAINTMFSGRNCLDIALGNTSINYNDSVLLKYLKNNKIKMSFISGYNALMEMMSPINRYSNKNTGDTDSKSLLHTPYVMFEGLCVLEKEPQNHLITMHSVGMHPPMRSLGSGAKFMPLGENVSLEDANSQFKNALNYLNEQIDWYFTYYQKTGCPSIVIGDHGLSIEHRLFHHIGGIKKDIPLFHNDIISPAFIVSGLGNDSKKEVNGMIPNTYIPDILLDIIQNANIRHSENYVKKYAFLYNVPAYAEYLIQRYIKKGMFVLYEGSIGIKTKNELYIKTISERELYFRPGEYSYQNLINNEKYKNEINKCRDLVKSKKYPVEIYSLEKYKYHMNMLELYDKECFDKIRELLSAKASL